MHVVILAGLSGSGKSTIARAISSNIFSADSFMVDQAGHYDFKVGRLAECHGKCFRAFIEFLQVPHSKKNGKRQIVVVDNTNTTRWEIAPYMLAAQAYGADPLVYQLDCPVELAIERNVHGVDARGIQNQYKRLRELDTSFWPFARYEIRANTDVKSVQSHLLGILGH